MNHRNSNLRFWVVFVLLLAGGTWVHWWQRAGEASVKRRSLREFPARVGDWQQTGPDERFDSETEKVLRADDYLSRRYAGEQGRVSLYVGYYASQRNGATYHSPLNCLPGAGWVMDGQQLVTIQPGNGRQAFTANRYIISNGEQRELLLYWYEGRGRAVASEYWGKFYTVWDSIGRRRSDGAMVRVMLPLGESEAVATQSAVNFAAAATPYLAEFIPD